MDGFSIHDSQSETRNVMVRPEGLEPPAYWFEANRSIQLSYGRLRGASILTRSTKPSAMVESDFDLVRVPRA